MAYVVDGEITIRWVGDGGGVVLGGGTSQANNPGFGASAGPGSVGIAQIRKYQVREFIPGADAPTLANINTALTTMVADLAAPTGTVIITAAELALIQGWATGGV